MYSGISSFVCQVLTYRISGAPDTPCTADTYIPIQIQSLAESCRLVELLCALLGDQNIVLQIDVP